MALPANVRGEDAHLRAQLAPGEDSPAQLAPAGDKPQGEETGFRLLANTVPLLVWATRPDGTHEYFNRQWYDFTGMAPGSLGGPAWKLLFHPEDDERVRAQWRRNLASGEPYEIEYRLKSHAGEYRWFLCRALPVRGESGEIIRWFGTCTDIENCKRAEAALREAKAAAELASQSKDRFLAALSHELRTPLTPALVAAAALHEDPRLPADVRDQLAMIERHIALEARLIDDLLDLSAITSGKLHLRREPCDAHALVNLAADIVRDDAIAKEITLTGDCSAPCAGLAVDPARFQQVIWNLLRNAIKFTPRGGRVAWRTFNAAEPDGRCRWRLEVTDSGVGIAPQFLETIFEPFEQGEAGGDHRFGGIGMGLAIVRAIVKLHGGTITARSDGPWRGASFLVDLPGAFPFPDAVPEGRARGVSAAMALPAPAMKNPAGRQVLLVEDHPATQQVLASLLVRSGYAVVTAATAAAALAAAARQPFDLVISDLGLPDVSGIQLMEQLRAAHGLRGIALTGYGMEEDIARTRAAGFLAHLVKPVQIGELRRILASLG